MLASANGKQHTDRDSGRPGTGDIAALLAGLPLFHGVDGACLEPLVRRTRMLFVERGETLFQTGDQAKGLYLVVAGAVKILCATPRGEEKVLYLIGPGRIFGEPAVLMQEPYRLAAQTTDRSTLLLLPGDAVVKLMEQQPEMMRRIVKGLAQRLGHTLRDALEYASLPALERVSRFLVSLRDGEPSEDIVLPASKAEIASLLCISRETLSRIFAQLESREFIRMAGKRIWVTNPQGLVDLGRVQRSRPREEFASDQALMV